MEIRIENLHKYFGKVRAVEELTLNVNHGEFVALLGPSGCGKTTTLFTIAGIYKPTKGSIYFGENMMNEVPSKDRKIGMVFQSYALYPHLNVLDNITFPLKLKKVPKAQRVSKAKEVAEMLHIGDLMKRKPGELSGGQQQRVALARALAKEPEVLLLDEPLSNLDAKLRHVTRSEFKRLQKELNITTLFVTHDQMEAMTMADRIAVMKEGRLRQFSTPEEMYNFPDDLFTASFIGNPPMNLIDAKLVKLEGKLWLNAIGFRMALPEKYLACLDPDHRESDVILGVRPEDISVNSNGIKAEVYVVEPLGREMLVSVRIGENILKLIADKTFSHPMGSMVDLKIDAEKVQLFDVNTKKSLLVSSKTI